MGGSFARPRRRVLRYAPALACVSAAAVWTLGWTLGWTQPAEGAAAAVVERSLVRYWPAVAVLLVAALAVSAWLAFRLRQSGRTIRTQEQQLRSLYENAPVGIFQSTFDGRYLSANRHLARMYGFDSPEALATCATDIGHMLYVKKSDRDEIMDLLRRNGEVVNHETLRLTRGGRTIWVSSNMRVAKNAKGDVTHIDGFSTDVTDKKRAETELREAKEQAETADRIKSQLLANLSHDVRTPLAGVIGMLQLIRKGPGCDKSETFCEYALQAAGRLNTLFSNILSLCQAESRGLGLAEEPIDCRDLLEGTRQLFAPAAKQKNLAFLVETDPGVPRRLMADGARLQQIMNNLAGNAVKFTEAGTVALRACYLPGPPGPPRLLLTVADTGPGIADEEFDTLFDAFTQGKNGKDSPGQGVGLGLSITRRLVERMGGTLTVDSRPGESATFHVCIPVHTS